MGMKNMFKKRDPTEKELVDTMQKVGITTKTPTTRQEKFGAFKEYAQERQGLRPGMKPQNPYANMASSQQNPYSNNGLSSSHSYNVSTGTSSPYASYSGKGHDSGNATGHHDSSGAGSQQRVRAKHNPYVSRTSRARNDDELTLDLNAIPTDEPIIRSRKPIRKPVDVDSLDLNANPDEEDLNLEVDDFLPDEEQVNEEDEEVEEIKENIRFVKQESVALTRNTLRMAQEADASGTNTLGMLGSQSERLYNAEQNLLLADTQTKIAEDKVAELRRLNRSIFIPASGNPFNKKSRLREKESKLKAQKEQEKYLRETNRQGVYASEQRVKQGISSNSTQSDTFNKYQGEKHLQQAQRYQFENDSEDDEMEKELASNLDQIAAYSKKLKNTATIMGQEVGAQNERLRKIEEDADRLDIDVHLNNTRLNNIR